MTVICQLHDAGWLLSVSYMGQVIGVCQLHEAGWLISLSYKRQVGSFLSDTSGRLSVICQLLEADCRFSAS
jgi:hypothetical protein